MTMLLKTIGLRRKVRVFKKYQNFIIFTPQTSSFAENDSRKNLRVLPHVFLSDLGANFLLVGCKGEY